ncbi:hypothetical protein [Desulfosediminicola flagellatus]|uniref:hypothetical protein n=1 Tax=Desulfosediminicola flagellatus TaxID=2569541 RepID=UPI0010AC4F84|nr:hypothetical protein [Desulfosediminicola flagellatus]
MSKQLAKPVAVCSDCITYSFDVNDIDKPCVVKRGDYQCQGTYVDVTDPINWKECTACSGTAVAFDGASCLACQESGWLLTRRR